MIKKIVSRVLIVLTVATLASTILISAVFAKYTSNNGPLEVTVRPTQFNVSISSASSNVMTANFAEGGAGDKTFSYDVTVNSADSEAAAYITLKLTLSSEMKTLVDRASTTKGISCKYAVYKVSGSTETPLPGSPNASGSVWTSARDLLAINTTNTYRVKFTVSHTAGGTGEFIPDAVKVDVIATQVDPMK
jgi:hypothetical protein